MSANESTSTAPVAKPRSRKIGLLLLLAVVVVGIGGYVLYWSFDGRFHEETDDAYVSGNSVQVMAEAQGTVVATLADETSEVQQGQVLVRLDDTQAKVQLQEAEASLAAAVRHVGELYATDKQLAAREAAQQASLQLAKSEYGRFTALNKLGYYSDSALQRSGTQVQVNEHQLVDAHQALVALNAQIGNTTLDHHPEVALAAAQLRDAYLTLQRMRILAPVAGYVAKRNVQVGQQVGPGAALYMVIPLDQLWVDANFKETELANVRIGQKVRAVSDLYGHRIVYSGHVAGLAPGTGNAFALLPAQNATGNWIKVVQRVPVRIAIDASSLEQYPLRIGLSMNVEVDTHDRSGPILAKDASTDSDSTTVYSGRIDGADALIADIIRRNSSMNSDVGAAGSGH